MAVLMDEQNELIVRHPLRERVVHWSVAILFFLAALEWRHNYLTPDDRQWLRQPGDAFSGRDRRLPEAGRYNAGQKVLFWVMVACMVLLLLSGPAIWYQYFAWGLPVWLRRLAA